MEKTFRQALLNHLESTGTQVSELAAATGIKRDTIYAVTRGTTRNMNVVDAIRVAGYFGETVEQFMGLAPEAVEETLARQIAALTPEERRILSASIAALTASRVPSLPAPDQDEAPIAPSAPSTKASSNANSSPPKRTKHQQEQ